MLQPRSALPERLRRLPTAWRRRHASTVAEDRLLRAAPDRHRSLALLRDLGKPTGGGEKGRIKVPIAKIYHGLEEVGRAQENLESGRYVGKHIVVVQGG